ncbi:MAG TPA: TolC family protein [Cyclobacteriaceae bacterium]
MRVKLIGALFFIGVITANAQTPTRVLSFEEAVKIALQNSVLLNQQKNNLELSQTQKLSSIAGIGPSIQANGQVYQVNGNSFNSQTGQLINGVRDAVTGSISANMNLFSGFSRINSIRQYSNQLDAQAYYVNRTSQDVVNTVSSQYLQVMLDVELVKIAKENFDALDKQLQLVKEHVKVGSRSPVDEYNQDALTKAGELRWVQAEITLNNDKSLLTQTLLLDPFEQFEVEKPKWNMDSIGAEKFDVQELAKSAKQYRGDYLRAVKNEEAAKFGMRAATGQMMPTLYAFANYGSAYNFQHGVPDSVKQYNTIIVNDPSATSGYSLQTVESAKYYSNPETPRPFSEQFRKNNLYKSYGFQLTIPLFNGLQNRVYHEQQKVLYRNNQITRKNLEYQIGNDVIRAVRNYEGARKAYQVSIDQLHAAATAFQYETERYNLGVTNFADFTNANRVFVQAQTDKAQAEYKFVFQKVLLEYAVGTLKPEDIK